MIYPLVVDACSAERAIPTLYSLSIFNRSKVIKYFHLAGIFQYIVQNACKFWAKLQPKYEN